MALVLIGDLPEPLLNEIQARAAESPALNVEVTTKFAPSIHGGAALAVVGQAGLEGLYRSVAREERPPVYVVCERALDVARWTTADVAGFGPSSLPGLAADIVATCRRFIRTEEPEGLRLGSLVKPSAGTQEPLVGWGVGAGAELRRGVQSALDDIDSDAVKRTAPFLTISPRELLDLYSWAKFGAVLEGLTDDQRKGIQKRTGLAIPESPGRLSDHDPLAEHFAAAFLDPSTRAPRKPFLLSGESGTGKTIVARLLHQQLETACGRRLPFTHVNCSTLRDMAEVELFGAMRGAYTSADVTNPGKVIASCGGTLFLDELGTLSQGAQARLLLFLQDCTVTPMGWLGDALRVPVQIIGATNEHLESRVQAQQFRADLYYRFSRKLTLPALRDVKHDLPYLVDYMLQQDAVNPDRRIAAVSRPAIEKLLDHDYPGNVRELETVLAAAVRSARQARTSSISAVDVVFGETTLPRKDECLAFIVPAQPEDRRLLLLWSASWATWFLPTRPFAHEAFEITLRTELQERVGLEHGDYKVELLPDLSHICLIDYSRRERKMKDYDFRAVLVRVSESAERRIADRPTVKWVELRADGSIAGTQDPSLLSPTLRTTAFANALSRLYRTLAATKPEDSLISK